MVFACFAVGLRLGLQGGLGRIPRRAFRTPPTPSAHGMHLAGGTVSL
jgi:hypothetical protein